VKLSDLVYRNLNPKPWDEGDNLPWNEPGFSARMLTEHLNQAHDHASRRFEIIDRHVEWIHKVLLDDEAVPILDLGCGPGLYTSRLAKYGHTCTGIDFSPASIDHARQMTQPGQLSCTYYLGDIRTMDYGSGYGLVMLIFGEFNVFRPSDAGLILTKAYQALEPGGRILLEVSTCDELYDLGHEPSTWYTAPQGLFLDRPHLCLMESFYDPDGSVVTKRYYIVDVASSEVSYFSVCYHGYTHSDFQSMLQTIGYDDVRFYDSLNPSRESSESQFLVVVARKPNSGG
jgi:SAM-dependent methyltransferase